MNLAKLLSSLNKTCDPTIDSHPANHAFVMFFWLDPNDLNRTNFKNLLEVWAPPKSITIFHLNFMTDCHSQVYSTKGVNPQLTLTLQTMLSWFVFLTRSKWFKSNEFQKPSRGMSSSLIDYFFLFQFYDLLSSPGSLNKTCDPTTDSHPADHAFLMFFWLNPNDLYRTNFKTLLEVLASHKSIIFFSSQFYDLLSPLGLHNKRYDPTIDSHPANHTFVMFFWLDPNDLNRTNFKNLLEVWAPPKTIIICYLNFMAYFHSQVYWTKGVTPQLTLTLQTMLSWCFFLDPNDLNRTNFKKLLGVWAPPKTITIFYLHFLTYCHQKTRVFFSI